LPLAPLPLAHRAHTSTLNHARTAGTGRNLAHYPWPQITSMTLADVSAPMLAVAETKYFDDLKLPMRQPAHRARFVLADAERMVADEGADPCEVPLRRPRRRRGSGAGAGGAAAGAGAANSGGVGGEASRPADGEASRQAGGWRIWKQPRRGGEPEGQPSAAEATAAQQQAAPAPMASAADSSEANSAAGAAPAPAAPASRFWRRPEPRPAPAPKGGTGDGPAAPAGPAAARVCACGGGVEGGSGGGGAAGGWAAGEQLTTFAPQSFDSVVDTFGLCSCDNPVLVGGFGDRARESMTVAGRCRPLWTADFESS
jgi:hypothetical protein